MIDGQCFMYALRNKVTGLYYGGCSRTNSKHPRLYQKRPSMSWLPTRWEEKSRTFVPDSGADWEYVIYELKELKSEDTRA